MSEDKQDLNKIDKELKESQPVERAENVQPIRIVASDGKTKKQRELEIQIKLLGWFNDWDVRRKTRENLWIEIYKRYFSVPEKFKTPTRSSITQPMAFKIIEAALPKLANSIFTQENKFFDVTAINPDNLDDKARAEAIRRLLELQLDKANFFPKFLDFSKQLLLYGTSFFKVFWDVERNWVWERTPEREMETVEGFEIGEKIVWKEEKKYTVTKRQPGIEVLDIIDVYPDPDIINEQEGRGIFLRSWISREELREMGQGRFPIYGNIEQLDQEASGSESYLESRSRRFSPRGLNASTQNRRNEVELLEFWGRMDIDGDGIKEECQIVIADRQIVVRAIQNPFHHQKRPIVRGVMFPVPNEFYGLGMIEPVMSQIDELDTLKRQRLDNINQSLNAMWQVDPTADVELDTLISAPNQIILTSPLDAVKKLDTPDVTANAFNEAAILQQDIESATTPASIQGTPDSGRLGRTARGAALIIGQALEKFGMSTKLIEEMTLEPMLEMMYALDLQFIDDEDVLRSSLLYREIADLELAPEDIRANVSFQMAGISDIVGTEAKINQIISFMGLFGKTLAPESLESMAKKVWQLMGFSKNEIILQGAQPAPGTENVVDPSLSNAINGQVSNQGASAAPPAIPPQL
jgi:hypothetical protein